MPQFICRHRRNTNMHKDTNKRLQMYCSKLENEISARDHPSGTRISAIKHRRDLAKKYKKA